MKNKNIFLKPHCHDFFSMDCFKSVSFHVLDFVSFEAKVKSEFFLKLGQTHY